MVMQPLRRAFHQELELLEWRAWDLGTMVKAATESAVEALSQGDVVAGQRVDEADAQVNCLRRELEERALLLIATQQPAASDLRRLVAVLHLATDLERMGDYAAGIGRICVAIGHQPDAELLDGIVEMAERAIAMLDRALDALARRDVEAAQRVALEDDAVDARYHQLSAQLLERMVGDTSLIEDGTHLLWVAHNLERVADRVQNLCSRVSFATTGRTDLRRRGAA